MIEIIYSSEVDKAKAEGRPIVALESTIITHGMPYPRNVETAQLVEQDIRDAGATPATMAVLNGILHVGLEPEQLQELGQAKNVAKISRADMAACIATGGTGATTVAATMIAARMAGISVFATGGIGGVHKGGATSFDISADLQELAQTPVNVICAGAKAILDLELTLEYLETQGVPVITYGQDTLPAFWSAQSDLTAPLRMDDLNEIAKAYCIRRDMGLPGGQLIANPIPVTAQIPIEELAPILAQAQQEADKLCVTGKAVTPFLLQRIFELTEGRSLEANIALVRNNAKLAAHLAKELHKLTK
ncbi:pseudouridine-5'-phosphate glycosidase [Epibacterium ulvae]|uniref:pseudouridine-5'-phosphate glycosidase n=1 Tax=Epibacterium ulvae TaxID=1156985 RepID=UPI002492EE2B|nr:pseudouridine-5'-phosphate glycosidase [Epibacterium ulvae]